MQVWQCQEPFAMITNLSKLYFRFRIFVLLVQTEKVISMNSGTSTSSWKPWRWVRFDMIFPMRNIYINSNLKPLTKFNRSSRSTGFKYILRWNISQIITKTVPISTRIVISYAMKLGIPLWIWWKVKGNSNLIRISQLGRGAGGGRIVEQILASEERKKFKRARWCESRSGIRVRKLTIWVRLFGIEQW